MAPTYMQDEPEDQQQNWAQPLPPIAGTGAIQGNPSNGQAAQSPPQGSVPPAPSPYGSKPTSNAQPSSSISGISAPGGTSPSSGGGSGQSSIGAMSPSAPPQSYGMQQLSNLGASPGTQQQAALSTQGNAQPPSGKQWAPATFPGMGGGDAPQSSIGPPSTPPQNNAMQAQPGMGQQASNLPPRPDPRTQQQNRQMQRRYYGE